jgi:2'-5' RNA ligase
MPFALELALDAFARETAPLRIVFDRVAVFATTGVVFLAPVPDATLHDVQALCHRRLGGHGRQPWPHYAPAVWAPHCTLAQDLEDAAALASAREVAERIPLPLAGRLERAELVRFRPVHCLGAVPLGAPG